MDCKVSVLITFYNQKEYVDRAMESVLNQKTDFNFEILVGDDGSNDGTTDVLDKWIEKYPGKIKLFVMDRDNGIDVPGFRASRNRINLLHHVKGEYFIFLDGDDYFSYDNKLQKQVEILNKQENQDCVACAHNTDMLFEDGKVKPVTPKKVKEGKYDLKPYWRRLYFHTDSLLVRSNIIEAMPLDLLENNFNDNLITYAVLQHGKVYYIPESWAVYLQTGDGIWTSGNVIKNQIRNMMMFDLCNKINSSLKKETEIRIAFAWLMLLVNRKKIETGKYVSFEKEINDKQLMCSRQWIDYNALSVSNKITLICKALRISARRGIDEAIRHI